MRPLLIAVIFLSCATAALSQSLSINGVSVSLGESEAQARADLTAAGLLINSMSSDTFAVTAKRGDEYPLFGEIGFQHGKTSFVQREWLLPSTTNDASTVLTVIHSAVTSLLEAESSGQCTVSVKTQDFSPSEGISKTTLIRCARATYTHTLITISTDCSTGCSIGNISPSIRETITQNGT